MCTSLLASHSLRVAHIGLHAVLDFVSYPGALSSRVYRFSLTDTNFSESISEASAQLGKDEEQECADVVGRLEDHCVNQTRRQNRSRRQQGGRGRTGSTISSSSEAASESAESPSEPESTNSASSKDSSQKYRPRSTLTDSGIMSGLSFQLQSGVAKETVTVESQEISLRDLREEAVRFIKKHVRDRHFLSKKHALSRNKCVLSVPSAQPG